jgi:soluble lytic murein transglycosylase
MRVALACLIAAASGAPVAAQVAGANGPDSLQAAGRPWHAAEAARAAAARESQPAAGAVIARARAALSARRYDRARSLLVGQPWLTDHDALGFALLGEAEAGLGLHESAASRFSAARLRAAGAEAALFAVRGGVALEAAGRPAEAADAFREARRLGLGGIADWLRVREARVTRDTTAVRQLLDSLGPGPARAVPRVWLAVLGSIGDTAAAVAIAGRLGARREQVSLLLARGDTLAARAALYRSTGPTGRAPSRDDAAVVVELARRLPPLTAAQFVAHARALDVDGSRGAALDAVRRAIARGDSSGATLLLEGDALAAAGRWWPAERAYRAATRDSAVTARAVYLRARVLDRIGDPGARRALAAFADTYPADTAAPVALFVLAESLADRGDTTARQWFAEVIRRHPDDPRASVARFRLAAALARDGQADSAAALYHQEVARRTPQADAARYWLGRLAADRGDTAGARMAWAALAAADSLGYYGLRARRAAGLPPLAVASAPMPAIPPTVAVALARIDTLRLGGLDSEAVAEVRVLLSNAPADLDALLALSAGLAARGFGPAAVRLGWLAAARAPRDPRALRAVYPWPNRRAVEAEAAEFGVDASLFAALVRQESVFDAEARSRAGARGLAQLMPTTAAQLARGLDVPFEPEWLVVPDLNLHLGAAHLARLLARYRGRTDAAIAAYNAGTRPVDRWLERPEGGDPDAFLELIPYRETRGYVRAVLRNRDLYAALYPQPID